MGKKHERESAADAGVAKKGISRRACLGLMAAATGGLAVGVGGAVAVGHLGRAPEGPWRVLTPDEARLVGEIAEQIIPSDQDPGAREAGAVSFIDRQLDGPYRRFVASYRQGLACVQKTCQALHGKPFETLGWSVQTEVLNRLEAGRVPEGIWTDLSSQMFFERMRDHTMQSFYGSPRHGGNRRYASYRMMGLEYPRAIGRNRHPA